MNGDAKGNEYIGEACCDECEDGGEDMGELGDDKCGEVGGSEASDGDKSAGCVSNDISREGVGRFDVRGGMDDR